MRRRDREVRDPHIISDIIGRARIVHLGLVDGVRPYVVPLHYGFEFSEADSPHADARCLTLWCHSAREGRKIDVIRANPTAFVQIDCDETLSSGGERACSYGASYASVMGDAQARVIEEPKEKVRGLTLLMRTQTGRDFTITEAMAASVAVIRTSGRQVGGARSRGLAPHARVARTQTIRWPDLFCVSLAQSPHADQSQRTTPHRRVGKPFQFFSIKQINSPRMHR